MFPQGADDAAKEVMRAVTQPAPTMSPMYLIKSPDPMPPIVAVSTPHLSINTPPEKYVLHNTPPSAPHKLPRAFDQFDIAVGDLASPPIYTVGSPTHVWPRMPGERMEISTVWPLSPQTYGPGAIASYSSPPRHQLIPTSTLDSVSMMGDASPTIAQLYAQAPTQMILPPQMQRTATVFSSMDRSALLAELHEADSRHPRRLRQVSRTAPTHEDMRKILAETRGAVMVCKRRRKQAVPRRAVGEWPSSDDEGEVTYDAPPSPKKMKATLQAEGHTTYPKGILKAGAVKAGDV